MTYRLSLMGHSSLIVTEYHPDPEAPGCTLFTLPDGTTQTYGPGAIYRIAKEEPVVVDVPTLKRCGKYSNLEPCGINGHRFEEGLLHCVNDGCVAERIDASHHPCPYDLPF